jgi:hypothetical protein
VASSRSSAPRQEAHLVTLHNAGTHTSAELAELFSVARSTVVLRGPTGGLGHPIGTLYGFTRGDVASVRLTFATRPALIASARNGGFAITADARWKPQQLDLLDANGHTITSIDVGARHRSEH